MLLTRLVEGIPQVLRPRTGLWSAAVVVADADPILSFPFDGGDSSSVASKPGLSSYEDAVGIHKTPTSLIPICDKLAAPEFGGGWYVLRASGVSSSPLQAGQTA